MELSLESDAEALWQDALDLLAQQQRLPESVLAMLRNCTPVSMDDGVLKLTTPMRLVLKNVSKNAAVVATRQLLNLLGSSPVPGSAPGNASSEDTAAGIMLPERKLTLNGTSCPVRCRI